MKCFIQSHTLKSSSLKFDKIFNFDRFFPATYHFVEKSKRILLIADDPVIQLIGFEKNNLRI